MTEKCSRCDGSGKVKNLATLSPSDDEECPNCYGSGTTGKCAECGEDEVDGGVCKYCGADN